MDSLISALEQWFGALSNSPSGNFWGLATAFMRAFGYTGPDLVGSSSIAYISDWIVSLFGPLGNVYEWLFKVIDTKTFIEIVNKLFSLGK